jgi:3-oxoacyl-[acyl-carrier protein] reductase
LHVVTESSRSPRRFEGAVCFVTGGAGAGIGQAAARRFAHEGATIALNDVHERRNGEVVEALRRDTGATVAGYTFDVADRAAVDAAVADVLERFGRIDVLVNNAAVNWRKPFLEQTPEEWDRVIDVDLSACWYLMRAVMPQMFEQRRGAIVNVSSIAAWQGGRTESAYAAAKAGLHVLTRAAAAEGGPHNVRCNGVAPGIVHSRFVAATKDAWGLEDEIARTPLGRWGTADEVASVIAFLASDDSSYVTGETLSVSGGWYMHP